jgi:hypothetical protein
MLLIIGHAIWLGGLAYLAATIFDSRKAQIAAVAAAVLLPGQLGLLHYGEPFLTPRIYSEALTLFAVGFAFRGASIKAFLCFILAVAFHPLMALPGLVVAIIWMVKRPAALVVTAAVGCGICVGLGLLGADPFVRILQFFDPQWFSIVWVRDSFCFVSRWRTAEWLPIWTTIALGCYLLCSARLQDRKLIILTGSVGLSGIGVSLIGGDIARNVLIVDLQLWRAMWIPTVLIHMYAGVALISWNNRFGPGRSCFAAAFAALAFSEFFPAVYYLALPLCGLAIFIHYRLAAGDVREDRLIRALLWGLVGAFATSAIVHVAVSAYFTLKITTAPFEWFARLLVAALASAGMASLVVLIDRKQNVFWLAGLAALLAAASLSVWDQRSPWTRFVDSAKPPPDLVSLMPDSSEVYWEGGFIVPWFVLKRSNYFSCEQGTGALFSRETAIEYQRRFDVFEKLNTLDFVGAPFCRSKMDKAHARVDRQQLSEVCNSEGELGALVLLTQIPGALHRIWSPPVSYKFAKEVDGKTDFYSADRFFIYTCSQFRK